MPINLERNYIISNDLGKYSIPTGFYLSSTNGFYTLLMQNDGNLVGYDSSNNAFWASNTSSTSQLKAVIQQDGNFVIYDSSDNAIWATNIASTTQNNQVILQDDRNIVVQDSNNNVVWASGTNI